MYAAVPVAGNGASDRTRSMMHRRCDCRRGLADRTAQSLECEGPSRGCLAAPTGSVLLMSHNVVRKFSQVLVIVLASQMVPGAGEFLESAVHLVQTGHTAHALADGEHDPEGAEHGCSGPFHVCQCHSTIAFTAAPETSGLVAPASAYRDVGWWLDDTYAEGHRSGIFRPPIA
jgi:hypothetical protein